MLHLNRTSPYAADSLKAERGSSRALAGAVKLLVQPGSGVKPLIEAIDCAKESVEIAIFRFDRNEVEKALVRAVERGVLVHALIAYTNRGGEKSLRELELRLLSHGVTVARTADDLVRYHGKYMIIDRKELHVLAFNYTYLDMEHSRSFAAITEDKKEDKRLVAEAIALFEADSRRKPYQPGYERFLVSPLNAREQLSQFLKEAESQLLIYDPKIGDPAMIRVLDERWKSGVDVRIIGEATRKTTLQVRPLGPMRLHTRSIVRDGQDVFLGSQSLRASELETRREVGILFSDSKIAKQIQQVFEDDWAHSQERDPESQRFPAEKAAKKVAKALTKGLPPVTPVLETVLKEFAGDELGVEVDADKLELAVKEAVKEAVKASVREAVEEVSVVGTEK